ncbi:hypothetical protein AGLY_010506 [Aphis glycines]|uniref:Uncharacterized protein n=1 Tax=Aphis glycines TaxID=307491 RepID=A0A6G0TF28_APHGL|nr:hypothetical protein AGLY_010506 [Aphis glycines]
MCILWMGLPHRLGYYDDVAESVVPGVQHCSVAVARTAPTATPVPSSPTTPAPTAPSRQQTDAVASRGRRQRIVRRAAVAATAAGVFQSYAGGVRTASRDSAESEGLSSSSPRPSKPFTIDAILGLQAGAVGQSAAAAATAIDPLNAGPVTALDFSTGSAAAHGKKLREGNTK